MTRSWETDVLVSASDRDEQITIDGRQGTMQASGNRSGKLEEIIYTLPAKGAVPALAACHEHVVKRLDEMILQSGAASNSSAGGWLISSTGHAGDVSHSDRARWRHPPMFTIFGLRMMRCCVSIERRVALRARDGGSFVRAPFSMRSSPVESHSESMAAKSWSITAFLLSPTIC